MKYKKIHMSKRGYGKGWTLCGGYKHFLRTNLWSRVTCQKCQKIAESTESKNDN